MFNGFYKPICFAAFNDDCQAMGGTAHCCIHKQVNTKYLQKERFGSELMSE